MNTLLERNTVENVEQEQHNAMINERYRKLLSTVEDQFSAPTEEEIAYAPTTPVVDATPTVEQAPTVTEYRPSALAASVFTAEKFERMEQAAQPVAAPRQSVAAQTSTAVSYSLTALAKVAMAVFTLVVVAMLVLIGINSQILHRKSVRLKSLEEQKQELMEQNEEIRRYIQELQTEESIIERATQAGLLG